MKSIVQKRSLGKYGEMRRQYLVKHQPALFNRYAEQGYLSMHLELVNEEMQRLINDYIRENVSASGITAELKHTNPLEWTRRMNNLKAQAEEIFLFQLVYAEEYPKPEEIPF